MGLLPREYGVSTVSMFPYSLGPNGANRSIDIATEAGYFGIQALPMRGWSYKNIRDWEDYVMSFEDAWAYGSLSQAFWRTLGVAREPFPTLLDWMLFGKAYSTIFPKALPVLHSVQKNCVIEMHNKLWIRATSYINFAEEGGSLCWDTHHTRKLDDWEYLLEKLPVVSLKLIHVHPTREEIQPFLRGEKSELTEMLSMLGHKFTNVPAIIEVAPPLKSRKGTIDYLRRIRKMAEHWLEF